jgi:hypothetical protein
MKAIAKMWTGDTRCNNCVAQIKGKLYDARVTRDGHWATLCERCFKQTRASLGTGRGQEYTQQSNGKFVKTAG